MVSVYIVPWNKSTEGYVSIG